jgi:hypothetical protein
VTDDDGGRAPALPLLLVHLHKHPVTEERVVQADVRKEAVEVEPASEIDDENGISRQS